MKKFLIPALFIAFIACKNEQQVSQNIAYPEVKKGDVVDEYPGGVKIPDPYRWLENDTSAETKAWVEAQNKVTFGYLAKIPYREKMKARLTEIINYPRYSSPFRAGEYYFFSKNDGLQNQPVIYYQKGLDGEPQVFIDPNALSPDGTVSISLAGFSKDKKHVAYTIQKSGSDWQEIHVREVATNKELSDKLEWVKFSGAAWKDNGFFYSRYDKPAPGMELSAKNEYQKIFYHRIGDAQEKDVLVFEDKTKPQMYFSAQTTEDERFLLVYISAGTDNFDVSFKDLSDASQKEFKPLFTGMNQKSSVIDNSGDKLIVQSNVDAPKFKVVLVDPKNPAKENWQPLIPEKEELLDGVGTAGGKIFASYLKDVTSRVYQYDVTGKMEREITLPALGTSGGFGGNRDDKIIFYTFTSFTYPPAIYRYDIAAGTSEVFRKSEVKFTPGDYETKQVFYESSDGTKIPMFIVHKKGISMDGSNPALLYGYGGFSISLTPSFSASRIAFLENGGVYCMANLRGGGEYGEEWHKGGMLLNKKNVFNDFIAAAEYLIREKYTSPEKLAIQGGSNGGLLVGACMNMRPDLFKVALPAVGVMDMLRFNKFTVGWGWMDDYGNPDSAAWFEYIRSYSPLHNIRDGINYPATLVTTADHDDRVVPAHSFKFISELQSRHKGDNPVLIRIETKAGHGGGKPLSKIIEETADIYSFLFYNTNHTPANLGGEMAAK